MTSWWVLPDLRVPAGPSSRLAPTTAVRTTLPSSRGPIAVLTGVPAGEARGTLLLVPGYTGSKEDFVPLLDDLALAGIRAVAVDLPGQYESDDPGPEESFRPVPLGAVVGELVALFGAPLVLLGHSFGGLVTRQTLLQGTTVAGYVILDSGPAALPAGLRRTALVGGEPILRAVGPAAVFDGTAALLGNDLADPGVAFERRRFLATSPAALLGMGTALLTEPDLSSDVAALCAAEGIPVAVIAGVRDDAWPPAEQAVMARTYGTELILIPQAAHSPAIENPRGLLEVLLPLLDTWFARTGPGPVTTTR